MNQRNVLLLLVLTTVTFLFETSASFAADMTDSTQARLENAIQKVNLETASLQKEVKRLRAELREIKKAKQSVRSKNMPAAEASNPTLKETTPLLSSPFINITRLGRMPVLTGDLPDGGTDLDPSAFLSNQPSMAQGMFFLEQQQALEKKLDGAPLPYADRPQLMLGGKLEMAGLWQDPYTGAADSNLDLVTAEIEALAQVSPWASGFLAIDYHNGWLDPLLTGSGNPTNNSTLYLNRGFLTIGNLNKSPIYFSAGQMYAPFGAYSSNMLTNSVTKVLGRTNTRAIQLGFDKAGFDMSAYAFNGAPNVGRSTVDNWGANTSYRFNLGKYSTRLGMGYINDITDSQGAQLVGSSGPNTFVGFSQNSDTERLVHYVPGVDANILLGRGPFYLTAEAIAATRHYAMQDMVFNNQGAQPKAGHVELGYNFNLFGKKSIFDIAYDETWNALALDLPKNSYIATFNISIWKNTIEVLEFRHDVNYAVTDTSRGACANSFTTCPGPSGGGQSNTVLAQFGVYF